MQKARVPFGVKLTVLVLAPMVILATVIFFAVQQLSNQFVERQMLERGLTLVNNLSSGLEYPMYVGINEQMEQSLKALTRKVGKRQLNPDLAFVLVLGKKGEILLSEGKDAGTPEALDYREVASRAKEVGSRAGQQFYSFYAPINYTEIIINTDIFNESGGDQTIRRRHHLGSVVLGLDMHSLRDKQKELTQTMLQATGAAVVIVLMLAIILTRSVSRPIGRLREGVLALAQGRLDTRIEVSGNDEISEAARQFNTMAESLQQQTENLKQSNQKLGETSLQLERRMSDLKFLYDLELEAASYTSLDELAKLFANQLDQQFGPGLGLLMEETSGPRFFGLEVSVNHPMPKDSDLLYGKMALGQKARLFTPGSEDEDLSKWALLLDSDFVKHRSVMALGIVVQKATHGGVLLVSREGSPFTMEDLRLLEMTATAYANHVERVSLIEREIEVIKVISEREAARRYTSELEMKNRELADLNENLKSAYDNLQRTQEQLVQSEKLAMVGTLAGGIAHEINNPLGAILANTQMLLRKAEDQGLQKGLGIIEKGALRCKGIVERVLNFARNRSSEHGPVDLVRVVEDTLSLLQHQLKFVAIEKNYQDCPPVTGDVGELEQVVTNLLINAHYAMMKAQEESGITPLLKVEVKAEGNTVLLVVADNGIGMSEDVRNKIFDPFFTTKEVGQGTGLGLSVSYSILQSHHAQVVVNSRPGEGAEFRLAFPRGPKA